MTGGSLVGQTVQIAASLCVLVPFVLAQAGRLDDRALSYLALNLLGSAVLAVDAAHGSNWGFLLLEGTWALVSLLGLLRALATRRRAAAQTRRAAVG